MTQFINNAQDSETPSQYASIRLAELTDQRWNRNKSVDLAESRDPLFPTLPSARNSGRARGASPRCARRSGPRTCAASFPTTLIATIVEGTDVRTGTLDPLGAQLAPGPDAYFELMRGAAGT